jgi:hypothetical protein
LWRRLLLLLQLQQLGPAALELGLLQDGEV